MMTPVTLPVASTLFATPLIVPQQTVAPKSIAFLSPIVSTVTPPSTVPTVVPSPLPIRETAAVAVEKSVRTVVYCLHDNSLL
jgi:hypothetical protein